MPSVKLHVCRTTAQYAPSRTSILRPEPPRDISVMLVEVPDTGPSPDIDSNSFGGISLFVYHCFDAMALPGTQLGMRDIGTIGSAVLVTVDIVPFVFIRYRHTDDHPGTTY